MRSENLLMAKILNLFIHENILASVEVQFASRTQVHAVGKQAAATASASAIVAKGLTGSVACTRTGSAPMATEIDSWKRNREIYNPSSPLTLVEHTPPCAHRFTYLSLSPTHSAHT